MKPPKKIMFRNMEADVLHISPCGGCEPVPNMMLHARLYNPVDDSWRWYASSSEIPTAVMAHLWPEERDQVRRLLKQSRRS